MRQPERSGWVPDWLEDFLARSPDLLLATTNIQTAPGAAAQAVATPLVRAILPKIAERAANIPGKASRLLNSGISQDMVGAILKKYPRTLGRMGHLTILDTPVGSSRGSYRMREPGFGADQQLGNVTIAVTKDAPNRSRELEHLVGHELFGHGPQDVLGKMKQAIASGEDAQAMRGSFLPPWVAQTVSRLNTTPYFRRQAIPDLGRRANVRANLQQVRYESAPTELAANARSLKMQDLARQQMLERTGEPYIPGLGPRENITKVNQHRTDMLRNWLNQFRVSNPLEHLYDDAFAGEQELDDIFFRLQEGLHKLRQPGLPLR